VNPADHLLIVKDQAASGSTPNARRKKLDNSVTPIDDPDPAAVAVASKGSVMVQVFVKGHPDRPGIESAKNDRILIATTKDEQTYEDVRCLFCRTEVE
jgi:hypothetical protein